MQLKICFKQYCFTNEPQIRPVVPNLRGHRHHYNCWQEFVVGEHGDQGLSHFPPAALTDDYHTGNILASYWLFPNNKGDVTSLNIIFLIFLNNIKVLTTFAAMLVTNFAPLTVTHYNPDLGEAQIQMNTDIYRCHHINFTYAFIKSKLSLMIVFQAVVNICHYMPLYFTLVNPPLLLCIMGEENGLLTVCKDMARCSTSNLLCSSGLFTLTWMPSHSRSPDWGSLTPHVLICVLVMKRRILFTVWTFYFNYNNVSVSSTGSCADAPTAQRDFSSSIEYWAGGVGHNKQSLLTEHVNR